MSVEVPAPPRLKAPASATAAALGSAFDEAVNLTKALKLPHIRRAMAEVIPTAKAQRWDPAEIVRVLLTEEALVAQAAASIQPDEIQHPGLRRLLVGLYALLAEGVPPNLDQLRARLLQGGDDGPLAQYALNMQEVGLQNDNRAEWFRRLLDRKSVV